MRTAGGEVLAEALVERVLGEDAEIADRFTGAEMLGARYEPPFPFIPAEAYGEKGHTVLPGDFVSADDGTGIVHTAIAFGEDDFRLGAEQGLAVVNPVRLDGTYDERIGPYAGRWVKDADADLIEDLRARGRLHRAETHPARLPALLALRHAAALLRQAVLVHPHVGDARPAARRQRDGRVAPAAHQARPLRQVAGEQRRLGDLARALLGHAAARLALRERAHRGVGSFAEVEERSGRELPDPHRPYVDEHTWPCAECGAEMRRVPEVIDVWFDSGSMPFAQRHAPFENEEQFRATFPADYICEAIDQTRGWFYSLIAISTLLFDRAPYRTVLCLGHIADPQGKKMSKSLGNIVVPWEVIQHHGADAFRWYYLTSKQPWDGYLFSTETRRRVRAPVPAPALEHVRLLRPLRERERRSPRSGEPETELDRWAISRLERDDRRGPRADGGLRRDARRPGDRGVRRRALELVRPALAAALLGRRPGRVRDAASTPRRGRRSCSRRSRRSSPTRSSRTSTAASPACTWPTSRRPGQRDVALETAMAVARETVRLGLAARGHGKLKVRQPLRAAVVVAAGEERAAIERLEATVRDELNVKELRFVSEAGELGSYEVKPNYRALGPRFGKQMPQVAAAVAALDPAHVAAALRDGGRVGISVDGHDHELGPDDLTLALQPLAGYQLEREGSHAVALELELDDELRREGLAREVVHAVQNARKGAGLQVEDRIELALGRRRGAARRRARPRGLPRRGDARGQARRSTARATAPRRPSRAARCGSCALTARLERRRTRRDVTRQRQREVVEARGAVARDEARRAPRAGIDALLVDDGAVRRRVDGEDERDRLARLAGAAAEPQQRRLAAARSARSA